MTDSSSYSTGQYIVGLGIPWLLLSGPALLALIGVLRHPRRRYEATGHSKGLWIVLQVLGLFTCMGWLTGILWLVGRTRADVSGRSRGGGGSAPAQRAPGGQAGSGGTAGQGTTTCSCCSGRGTEQCPNSRCMTGGRDVATGAYCQTCGGRRTVPCRCCGGKGYR